MPRKSKSNHENHENGSDNDGGGDDDNVGVMEQSNLTEEQRRQIRREQRALYKDLEEQDQLHVEDARNRNNEIYKNVRYTREAVLDGENLTLIASKAAQRVERMIQVPRYDAENLTNKLVQKLRTSNGFDWYSLGIEAGVCFNAIPSGVSWLNGPLTDGKAVQVKQRTQRRQLLEEDGEAKEERPEDVQGHTARSADALSAGERNMKALSEKLHEKVDEQYKKSKRHLQEVYNGEIPKPSLKKLKKFGIEICGTKFLFNPHSFTQTVENIFNFAFAIKNGGASIAVRDNGYFADEGLSSQGGLRIKYTNQERIDKAPKQAILSLSMRDYRRMVEAYQVTEGDLPNRTGSKHTPTKRQRSSMSQSLSQDSSA